MGVKTSYKDLIDGQTNGHACPLANRPVCVKMELHSQIRFYVYPPLIPYVDMAQAKVRWISTQGFEASVGDMGEGILPKRGADFDTCFDTILTLWCRKKLN